MQIASRSLVFSRLAAAFLLVTSVGLAACDALGNPPVGGEPLTGTYVGEYRGTDPSAPNARAVFELEEEDGQVQGTVTFVYVSGNEATRDVNGTYTAPDFDLVFAGSFFRGTASPDGEQLSGEMGAPDYSVPLTVRRE